MVVLMPSQLRHTLQYLGVVSLILMYFSVVNLAILWRGFCVLSLSLIFFLSFFVFVFNFCQSQLQLCLGEIDFPTKVLKFNFLPGNLQTFLLMPVIN
jgi:hypothetical protein